MTENLTVAGIDDAILVDILIDYLAFMHAGDAAVGAGLLGILEVGDAEDLVAIDYIDVVADEPLVAHAVLLAAIQLDDTVDVATIGEGGLPTPVACLHIKCIEGDLDTAVANLTNVAHDGACA